MTLMIAAVAAAFLGTVLSAALPASGSNKASLDKRDHVKALYIWNTGPGFNNPSSYPQETDDAWQKVELEFPIQIFDKSNTTAWISMNGIFCLDDPTGLGPSVPATSLPVGASQCNGKGCLPSTCVLPFWGDYYLPKKSEKARSVRLTYHYPSTAPQVGHHYHVGWDVCSKASQASSAAQHADCGDQGYEFQMNIFKSHPGKFYIYYFNMPDHTPGIIGAQSLPNFIQASGSSQNAAGPKKKVTCAIIDTIAGTVITGGKREDCAP
ncbi:hypothetical protein TWF696_001765 [Orbilia brochopaga]|uniref:Uncharacterized protein n=1 Tax=Orbilia brochopaga TaxID=3140254 RepID=A0AAV9U5Q0_9PEZI